MQMMHQNQYNRKSKSDQDMHTKKTKKQKTMIVENIE